MNKPLPACAARYPVTGRQRFQLDMLTHTETCAATRDLWVVRVGFLVTPKLDIRRLSRAVAKLLARHDTLRIRFGRGRNGWVADIDDARDVAVESIDLGEMDEAEFPLRLRQISARPMQLAGGRLVEVLHVRCGRRGDAVIFRAHHSLVDATGMIVLTEDLLKFLVNLPVLQPAMSHAEYIERFEFAPPTRAVRNDAYWARITAGFPKAPMVGRRAKGLEPSYLGLGEIASEQFRIHAGETEQARLADRARAMGTTSDVVYYTAYAEAFCRRFGLDEFVYTVPLGRPEPELARYCGDRVSDIIIRHRPGGTQGFARAVALTHRDLIAAIEHVPCPRLLRHGEHDRALIAEGCYPRQFEAVTAWTEARARQSVFHKDLHGQPGEVSTLGPYRLTMLDVGPATQNSLEMVLKVGFVGQAVAFQLAYDPVAYQRDEIAGLGQEIVGLTGLVPTRMDFS
ncbi:MAG: hypothetical protein GY717_19130 [Rhodobacteraceae bacterium]|nr:hypothetical protein [Paracoccaceae bacterium]